ncbi:hypothetical protein [Thermoactinomyces sp. DSM 45892]|uniref:hypothetical protein n=1 Tax=Thermoactinomyces sp. DSM 45892 TaxID=1882753 RepID=UPI0008996C86|nr:hypothetical protein [Thermoactinomyces sp. DSM 45892]SDZ13334.1 hypothetical protein SAMN05444416_11443 [Thermoactinomyces sp. DSM 45892]
MTMRWVGIKISVTLTMCIVFIANMSKQASELKQLCFLGMWGALALLVLMAYKQEWKGFRKKMEIEKEYRKRLEWMNKEQEYYHEQKRMQRSFYDGR